MARRDPQEIEVINLSTTERDLLFASAYDSMYGRNGGSLHYLNPDTHVLTTFRCLRCIESPSRYRGTVISSELNQVQVSPLTGEFVHTGEHESLQKFMIQKKAREQKKAQLRELRQHELAQLQSSWNLESGSGATPRPQCFAKPTAPHTSSQERRGECVFCGKLTADWWSYTGATGMCKCNDCKRQGIT
jgi:hypothetical protein